MLFLYLVVSSTFARDWAMFVRPRFFFFLTARQLNHSCVIIKCVFGRQLSANSPMQVGIRWDPHEIEGDLAATVAHKNVVPSEPSYS